MNEFVDSMHLSIKRLWQWAWLTSSLKFVVRF